MANFRKWTWKLGDNITCIGGGEIITDIKTGINLNPKKFHKIMNVAHLKVTHGLRFLHLFFFLAPDCWCLFTGIVIHDHLHSVTNMRCERSQMREWRLPFYFFWSNCDGAPLGVCALRKLRTLRIGSGGTGPIIPKVTNEATTSWQTLWFVWLTTFNLG